MFNIETLRSKSDAELAKISKDLGVKVAKNSTENDKIFAILDFQATNTKAAKDYYNATENPMTTEESSTPAKKPAAKKPAPKKKTEKPAEASGEINFEGTEATPKTEVQAETPAEKPTNNQNQQKKKRQRIPNSNEEVVAAAETETTVEPQPKVENKNQNQNGNQQNQQQKNQNQRIYLLSYFLLVHSLPLFRNSQFLFFESNFNK